MTKKTKTGTIKNVFCRNKWTAAETEQPMEPTPTPFTKIKHDDKSDRDFVKLKLHRDPMSNKSELYEFKISLFDNGNTEEVLLFVCTFNMNLETTGTPETATKVQYFRTLVCGEALCQFDSLSTYMESANPLTVEAIILGLVFYFHPVYSLLKQNCTLRRGMKNPHGLKVMCYANHLIEPNEYLALFPGKN